MNKTSLRKYATECRRNIEFKPRKGYEAGSEVMVYDGKDFNEENWGELFTKYGQSYTMDWKEALSQIEPDQVWEVFTREWDEHFSNPYCRNEALICDVTLIDFRSLQ